MQVGSDCAVYMMLRLFVLAFISHTAACSLGYLQDMKMLMVFAPAWTSLDFGFNVIVGLKKRVDLFALLNLYLWMRVRARAPTGMCEHFAEWHPPFVRRRIQQ